MSGSPRVQFEMAEVGSPVKIPGSDIRLLATTFNCGNARIEGIEHVVPPAGGNNDLLVFGMQESTYTVDSETCVHEIIDMVMQILGPEYMLVSHSRTFSACSCSIA
jgi:hypothetical protein